MPKEAKARIRINKLLEEAGWRFFDTDEGRANIDLETNLKITEQKLMILGKILKRQKMVMLIFYCLMNKDFPWLF